MPTFSYHVISFIVAGLALEKAKIVQQMRSFPERPLEHLGKPAGIKRTCCECLFVPLGRRNRIRIVAALVIRITQGGHGPPTCLRLLARVFQPQLLPRKLEKCNRTKAGMCSTARTQTKEHASCRNKQFPVSVCGEGSPLR